MRLGIGGERQELLGHCGTIDLLQVVPSTLDGAQPVRRGDFRRVGGHFISSAEGIARPMNEHTRGLDSRQVGDTQVGRFVWRMQWVGED